MTWRRVLAGCLLLVSQAYAADKAWLHPRCNQKVVKAFNEARYVAELLNQALDLQRETDLEFLDDPLGWFFNFNTEDGDHIIEVQERLIKIGLIERTFTREEATIRFYCDNMDSWIPADGNRVPQTWPDTDTAVMNTYFRHETEGVFAFGKDINCRHDNEQVLAATTAYTAARNVRDGADPIDNVIIDLCALLEIDLAATSNDAVGFPLSSFQEVSELHTIAYTIIHELIHVPSIGGGTVDGHQIFAPSDTHVTSTNEQKSGYYTSADAPSEGGPPGVSTLPGPFLGEAHLTITNPDSYMYICMFYRFWEKGWEMKMDPNTNRLVFAWEPPEQGTPEAAEWKEVDLPDGQGKQWRWAGTEWPTDQPPNWTDEPTPGVGAAPPAPVAG